MVCDYCIVKSCNAFIVCNSEEGYAGLTGVIEYNADTQSSEASGGLIILAGLCSSRIQIFHRHVNFQLQRESPHSDMAVTFVLPEYALVSYVQSLGLSTVGIC